MEKPNTAPAGNAPGKPEPHRKPRVGDDVWYYDESRAAYASIIGAGPYTARVTCIEPRGVHLFVMGPQGGRFDADRIAHKSELGDVAGKKKWWEWPPRG